MEIFVAATLTLILIVINAVAIQQRRDFVCQQEVRNVERFARKK